MPLAKVLMFQLVISPVRAQQCPFPSFFLKRMRYSSMIAPCLTTRVILHTNCVACVAVMTRHSAMYMSDSPFHNDSVCSKLPGRVTHHLFHT